MMPSLLAIKEILSILMLQTMYPIVPKTESATLQTPKMKLFGKKVRELLAFAESLILDV